jgi:hypothetical protein
MALVLNKDGQPANGWYDGKFYRNGVAVGPFALVYDGGGGYKPFTGWAAPWGLKDQPFTDGIPNDLLNPSGTASSGGAASSGGTTSSGGTASSGSTSSTPVPSIGSYPNPYVWIADDSLKVLLQNDANNNPVLMVPYPLKPDFPQSNNIWQNQTVTLSGIRNETLGFQLFLSPDTSSGWTDITVACDIPGCTVTSFLEWYIPLPPLNGGTADPLWKPGDRVPDPLIPFVDPATGNTVIASFGVAHGTTQGVWFDVKLGPSVTKETGTLTVAMNGTVYRTIPVIVEAAQADAVMPAFNSDPSRPKAWAPLYATRFLDALWGRGNHPALTSPEFIATVQAYQKAFHAYGMDTQLDQMVPPITWTNDVPAVDWTTYDPWQGAALTGTLFGDGTSLRVFNAPFREEDNLGIAWSYTTNTLPPAELLTRISNLGKSVSEHFKTSGYRQERLLGYVWDEPGGKTGVASDIWQVVLAYGQAFQNTGIDYFVTWTPYNLNPNATGAQVADATDLVPVTPVFAMPGPNFVPSLEPATNETWVYQYGEPFIGNHTLYGDGMAMRSWWWIAEIYDVKGLFVWGANFWPGNVNGDPSPTDATMNPYIYGITDGDGGNKSAGAGDGVLCYPGSQLPLLNASWPAISGPVMSIRMASWRRGMQDSMLVGLLKAQGKTPPAVPVADPSLPLGLNPARVYPYWRVANWLKPGNWTHDPDVADTWRKTLEGML